MCVVLYAASVHRYDWSSGVLIGGGDVVLRGRGPAMVQSALFEVVYSAPVNFEDLGYLNPTGWSESWRAVGFVGAAACGALVLSDNYSPPPPYDTAILTAQFLPDSHLPSTPRTAVTSTARAAGGAVGFWIAPCIDVLGPLWRGGRDEYAAPARVRALNRHSVVLSEVLKCGGNVCKNAGEADVASRNCKYPSVRAARVPLVVPPRANRSWSERKRLLWCGTARVDPSLLRARISNRSSLLCGGSVEITKKSSLPSARAFEGIFRHRRTRQSDWLELASDVIGHYVMTTNVGCSLTKCSGGDGVVGRWKGLDRWRKRLQDKLREGPEQQRRRQRILQNRAAEVEMKNSEICFDLGATGNLRWMILYLNPKQGRVGGTLSTSRCTKYLRSRSVTNCNCLLAGLLNLYAEADEVPAEIGSGSSPVCHEAVPNWGASTLPDGWYQKKHLQLMDAQRGSVIPKAETNRRLMNEQKPPPCALDMCREIHLNSLTREHHDASLLKPHHTLPPKSQNIVTSPYSHPWCSPSSPPKKKIQNPHTYHACSPSTSRVRPI
ncbi:hypothetical protein BJ508DRAFT_313701 [Ascobolus immersus RN42]|uniref:Uncharacterized protein n=1 Tax=Ascobolus immersus RN42 TaxID=1160509 RepID=A0A3N4HHR7_ASCIM|nr:hypothetical protein BJ508DRAFT_313701 [Ascobolus immersus RN42]